MIHYLDSEWLMGNVLTDPLGTLFPADWGLVATLNKLQIRLFIEEMKVTLGLNDIQIPGGYMARMVQIFSRARAAELELCSFVEGCSD